MSDPVALRRGRGTFLASQRYMPNVPYLLVQMLRNNQEERVFEVRLSDGQLLWTDLARTVWSGDLEDQFAKQCMTAFHRVLMGSVDTDGSLCNSMQRYPNSAHVLYSQRHLTELRKPSGLMIWRQD